MQDVTNEGRRGITTPLSAESVTSAMDGKHQRPELVFAAQCLAYALPYQRFACSLTTARA